jgi:hypothetical protein
MMSKLLLVGLALCAAGALVRAEEDPEKEGTPLTPFLAALAIEVGIFLLRRRQGALLYQREPAL